MQQIAPVQPSQLVIGQIHQVIERQPLGKLTEFIPFFGADKLIEIAPVVVLALALADLLKQRLLIDSAGSVAF
ncbi:hypothetical protein D3C78_1385850 [compost metagenome]